MKEDDAVSGINTFISRVKYGSAVAAAAAWYRRTAAAAWYCRTATNVFPGNYWSGDNRM